MKAGLACGAAGAVVVGAALLSSCTQAQAECTDPPHHSQMSRHLMSGHLMSGDLMIGPTCNVVEMVPPAESTYVPDMAAASRADRVKARQLLRGVNEFCRSHSAAQVIEEWTPGPGDPESRTHYFNSRADSLGLNPAEPRAALVYDGEIGGVMFTGVPLPRLGSIPRAHSHDMSRPREMVHVYCTSNLKDAFTPNRMLGVLADTKALIARIRAQVPDLTDARLRAALKLVREYAAGDAPPADPSAEPAVPGVDPLVFARRDEVRRSLAVLSEAELRAVWKQMNRG